MTGRKQNPEFTVLDRLRIILGLVTGVSGALIISIVFLSDASSSLISILGFGLVTVGVLIAASHKVTAIIADIIG